VAGKCVATNGVALELAHYSSLLREELARGNHQEWKPIQCNDAYQMYNHFRYSLVRELRVAPEYLEDELQGLTCLKFPTERLSEPLSLHWNGRSRCFLENATSEQISSSAQAIVQIARSALARLVRNLTKQVALRCDHMVNFSIHSGKTLELEDFLNIDSATRRFAGVRFSRHDCATQYATIESIEAAQSLNSK
jgi:hypothetical protein